MGKSNDAWGIEVGSNALKAVRLVIDEEGQVQVADYDVMDFKEILSSPEVDADDAIQVQLDKFLATHDATNSSVCVSLPGHMECNIFPRCYS